MCASREIREELRTLEGEAVREKEVASTISTT